MPKLRNGSKGDSNPGSLDCESVILPLSYRASRMFETGLDLWINVNALFGKVELFISD